MPHEKQSPASVMISHPAKIPELYADGAEIIAGWPNSKLIMNSVVPKLAGDPNSVERRESVFILTMPTVVLMDLCRQVVGIFIASRDQLTSVQDLHLKTAMGILDSLRAAEPTAAAAAVTPAKSSRKTRVKAK